MVKPARSGSPVTTGTTALPGRATARGTSRFRERHSARFADDFYRPLGDLACSSIGAGTYLGECDDTDDARYHGALVRAVRGGVNVIDSAINYRCQRSERAIGRALRDAMHEGATRDEIVLCTKGGYIPLDTIPPSSKAEYQAYLERTFFEPGLMTPSDVIGGGHCFAPKYLAHQISASRANFGIECIDLYYLHNPEQQLAAITWESLRQRLVDAFTLLEERVAAGAIARYGCATWNGLRVPPGEKEHLPLAELVAIANDVGGKDHHFSAVQLPINLAMPDAVRTPTQRLPDGRLVPALEAAQVLGLAVFVSAPLLQGRLTQGLPAAVADAFPHLQSDAQRAIAFARTLPGVTAALVGMKSAAHVEENVSSGFRAQGSASG